MTAGKDRHSFFKTRKGKDREAGPGYRQHHRLMTLWCSQTPAEGRLSNAGSLPDTGTTASL